MTLSARKYYLNVDNKTMTRLNGYLITFPVCSFILKSCNDTVICKLDYGVVMNE